MAVVLHDRTGRLENHQRHDVGRDWLHDRTGRLESLGRLELDTSLPLHDRTGRLER